MLNKSCKPQVLNYEVYYTCVVLLFIFYTSVMCTYLSYSKDSLEYIYIYIYKQIIIKIPSWARGHGRPGLVYNVKYTFDKRQSLDASKAQISSNTN